MEHITTTALIASGSFLVGFAGLIWKVGSDRKSDADANEKKVIRVYERLDAVKTSFDAKLKEAVEVAEDKFVNIKICKILHDTANENFERLDKKVDLLGEKIDRVHDLLIKPQ